MNKLYDQLNLHIQDYNYHLITFNGQDSGIVRFYQNIDLLNDGGVWEKIKACIDGITVNGYLDVSNLKPINDAYLNKIIDKFFYIFNTAKSFLIGDEDQIIKNSRVINDIVIKRLDISSEDKVLLSSLMHLGINYDEYLRNPQEAIYNFFGEIENKTEEKMEYFYSCFTSATSQEQIILKKIICDFISITKDIFNFMSFWPKSLFYDKDLMLAAINKNGYVFKYAPYSLKNDKDVVLAAVNKQVKMINYASDVLKTDKDVALAAVNKDGESLGFLSNALKADRDVVLAAINRSGNAIRFAHYSLKDDKDIILAAVIQNGSAIEHASEYLKYDKNFILSAVSVNGFVLYYLTNDLRYDKDVVIAAINKYWNIIGYVSVDLQYDPDVILAASISISLQLIKNIRANKIKILLAAGKSIIDNEYSNIINVHQIKQLIENYEKFKKNKYFYKQEANDYINAIIKGKIAKKNKAKENLKKKFDNKKSSYEELLLHLNLEADFLKTLYLENPNSLRIIFLMIKKIINYRNKEIKNEFINLIVLNLNNSFLNFFENLLVISNGKKDLILPSIILSNLDLTKEKQKELCKSLENKIKILENKTKHYLQDLLNLENKLKRNIPFLNHEMIADIINEILNSEDNNEILIRINFLIIITILNPKKIPLIKDFSSSNLLELIIDPLINMGILENKPENRFLFTETFLRSRIPYAIFTYISNFIHYEKMISLVKIFIKEVINETYLDYRYKNNSHKHLLNDKQKLIWKEGASEKLIFDRSEKVLFNAETFLRTKLIIDRHGNNKLDKIINVLEVGSAIRSPNQVEKLCIDLLSKNNPIEQLVILKKLEIALKDDEYKEVEFKNDVKDQINLMEDRAKVDVNLNITDTEDWQDLFFCGTELPGSCQRIDGDPEFNKCILGYVLDGKVRMIKIEKKDGSIVARAIIKIMKDSFGNPALLLERVYPNNKYALSIRSFAKKRSEALGVKLYEYCSRGLIRLYSEGNTAPFEYEDAGIGITNGSYIVNVININDIK